MSLTERPGYLRLKGRESILSNFRQTMLARRISAFKVSVSTCVEFQPRPSTSLPACPFYSTDSFYYLYISRRRTLPSASASCAASAAFFHTRWRRRFP